MTRALIKIIEEGLEENRTVSLRSECNGDINDMIPMLDKAYKLFLSGKLYGIFLSGIGSVVGSYLCATEPGIIVPMENGITQKEQDISYRYDLFVKTTKKGDTLAEQVSPWEILIYDLTDIKPKIIQKRDELKKLVENYSSNLRFDY